jgi:hypothetical protein
MKLEKTNLKSSDPLTPIEISNQIIKLSVLQKDIDSKLKALKDQLLIEMDKLDVLTLKTKDYLIARKKRINIKVENKKALEADLKKWDVELVYTLDLEYMRPVINKLINDGNELDGVIQSQSDYVSITVSKKKEGENEKTK